MIRHWLKAYSYIFFVFIVGASSLSPSSSYLYIRPPPCVSPPLQHPPILRRPKQLKTQRQLSMMLMMMITIVFGVDGDCTSLALWALYEHIVFIVVTITKRNTSTSSISLKILITSTISQDHVDQHAISRYTIISFPLHGPTATLILSVLAGLLLLYAFYKGFRSGSMWSNYEYDIYDDGVNLYYDIEKSSIIAFSILLKICWKFRLIRCPIRLAENVFTENLCLPDKYCRFSDFTVSDSIIQ